MNIKRLSGTGKKKTITSSSGRHLGHYNYLLTTDRVKYSKEKENFSEKMWKLHHNITSIALLNARPLKRMWKLHHNTTSIILFNARPLKRWLLTIVIPNPKEKRKSKIHQLRIINIYESDYNLIRKYFRSKVEMEKT